MKLEHQLEPESPWDSCRFWAKVLFLTKSVSPLKKKKKNLSSDVFKSELSKRCDNLEKVLWVWYRDKILFTVAYDLYVMASKANENHRGKYQYFFFFLKIRHFSMLKGKNVIFFGRSWRFSLSDFIHFPLKVRWTFWKYCNKTQRKAFFLNRWCVKFRNMRSLMMVKCYVPFLPHPLHLALPTSLGQTRCPSIPQDLPTW